MITTRSLKSTFLALLIAVSCSGTMLAYDNHEAHLLIIVDTDDAKIGPSVKIDKNNVWDTVALSLRSHKHLGLWQVLEGKDATPNKALAWLNKLPKMDDTDKYGIRHRYSTIDTIIVYYSGHGGLDAKGNHLLTMNRGNLSRKMLIDEIKGLNPRLGVLITDCCADFAKQVPLAGRAGPNEANWNVLHPLLFKRSGFVDVNSCKPRETSLCDKEIGGFYTFSLMQQFRAKTTEYPNKTPGWSDTMSLANDRLKQLTNHHTSYWHVNVNKLP